MIGIYPHGAAVETIILTRVEELRTMCENPEKPKALVYFRKAHYLKVRKQQHRLLIELKNKYSLQYNRTDNRKILGIKFDHKIIEPVLKLEMP